MSVTCDNGFLRVLRFIPPIKLTTRYNWKIVESGVKYHKPTNQSNKPWNIYGITKNRSVGSILKLIYQICRWNIFLKPELIYSSYMIWNKMFNSELYFFLSSNLCVRQDWLSSQIYKQQKGFEMSILWVDGHSKVFQSKTRFKKKNCSTITQRSVDIYNVNSAFRRSTLTEEQYTRCVQWLYIALTPFRYDKSINEFLGLPFVIYTAHITSKTLSFRESWLQISSEFNRLNRPSWSW